jgi:hypothetical protein
MKDKKQREAQTLPRTNFNSSRLVRFLADLALVDGSESKQAFAQRLGQWVSFTDADRLYVALDISEVQATVKPSEAQAGAQSAAYLAARDEFSRVRTTLMESMKASCSPTLGPARIKFPIPPPDALPEIAVIYSPFHHFYVSQQREMDSKVGPLRAMARGALAAHSPPLKQLATLDAALDKILSDRERRLLGTVPVLLKKRFEQLLKLHQQMLARAGQPDDPVTWMRPGAWLANFRDELLEALLAELDVRLQPAMGLIEAFSNEVN